MCFLYFCFSIRLHSSYSVISFPNCMRVHECECIFLVSNTWKDADVPDELHKVILVPLHWSGGGIFTANFKAAVDFSAARWQCCDSLRPIETACALGIFVIVSQGSSPFNTLLCYFWPQSHCCVLIVFRCGKLSLCNWKNNSFSVWKKCEKRKEWKCPAVIWWMLHTNIYM